MISRVVYISVWITSVLTVLTSATEVVLDGGATNTLSVDLMKVAGIFSVSLLGFQGVEMVQNVIIKRR